MIIDLYNVRGFLANPDNFGNHYLHGSRRRWLLQQTLQVQLSNGYIITIPKGFNWDLSSSPRWLWWLYPPFGDFMFAALIHDFLYVHNLFGRAFADTEMLRWSGFICTDHWDNYQRYKAVQKLGGGRWWRRSAARIAAEKAARVYQEPRVIAPNPYICTN
jgi:hypothetical protein